LFALFALFGPNKKFGQQGEQGQPASFSLSLWDGGWLLGSRPASFFLLG